MSRSPWVTTPADAYALLLERILKGNFDENERDGLYAALDLIRPTDEAFEQECVGSVVARGDSSCIRSGSCSLSMHGWADLYAFDNATKNEERRKAAIRLEQALTAAVGNIVVRRFHQDHAQQVEERNVLTTILPCCSVCYEVGSTLHLDHVVPKSKGGLDGFANYQLLCVSCNSSKRDKSMEEWMAWVNESDAPGADNIRQRREANADRVLKFLNGEPS